MERKEAIWVRKVEFVQTLQKFLFPSCAMETKLEQRLILRGKYCYFADNLKRLLSISLRSFSLPFKQPINADEK